jgi:hypothetical protein
MADGGCVGAPRVALARMGVKGDGKNGEPPFPVCVSENVTFAVGGTSPGSWSMRVSTKP